MRIFLILLFIALPTQVKAQQAFFETLYDVPVMVGLTEIPDMAMVFDKPDGRISQAGAHAKNVSNAEIQTFYKRILPQLGWKSINNKDKQGRYQREGEILEISFERPETVKFLLKPL